MVTELRIYASLRLHEVTSLIHYVNEQANGLTSIRKCVYNFKAWNANVISDDYTEKASSIVPIIVTIYVNQCH